MVNQIITSFSATFTEKIHNNITPDIISSKWDMVLKRAQETINGTTQQNVWSTVLPLTINYITDLLSHRFKYLDTRFYTDTLSLKGKLASWNSFTLLFTYVEFVFIHPIKSTSEAGDSLITVTLDIGIMPEPLSENYGEQTVIEYKFQ